MQIEMFDDKTGMTDEIRQDFKEEQFMHMEPEKYVLQTLDDAALVLTVCRMSLVKMEKPLPSLQNDILYRLTKVSQLLEALNEDVAQWNIDENIIDSSLEGD